MFKFYRVKSLKPNPHSVKARLPAVYKKFAESLKLPATPVHYIPETSKFQPHFYVPGERIRTENRPIPLKFPKEADEGIWGGEGVIQGFIKEKPRRRRFPNYWVPNLKKSILYSEILNSHMEVTVTERTLKLIDEHCGFDHYILGVRCAFVYSDARKLSMPFTSVTYKCIFGLSPVQDLKSQLALSIRRKMLLSLLNKEKNHPDEETNKEILEKYQKYLIPREEAEWFGLTEREAIQKQRLLEEEEIKPVPLKHALRAKYFEELKRKALEPEDSTEEPEISAEEKSGVKSWITKLNPFQSK